MKDRAREETKGGKSKAERELDKGEEVEGREGGEKKQKVDTKEEWKKLTESREGQKGEIMVNKKQLRRNGESS